MEAQVAPGLTARGGDTGTLLAAMLECVEAEIGDPRDIEAGRDDTEDAARLLRMIERHLARYTLSIIAVSFRVPHRRSTHVPPDCTDSVPQNRERFTPNIPQNWQ